MKVAGGGGLFLSPHPLSSGRADSQWVCYASGQLWHRHLHLLGLVPIANNSEKLHVCLVLSVAFYSGDRIPVLLPDLNS